MPYAHGEYEIVHRTKGTSSPRSSPTIMYLYIVQVHHRTCIHIIVHSTRTYLVLCTSTRYKYIVHRTSKSYIVDYSYKVQVHNSTRYICTCIALYTCTMYTYIVHCTLYDVQGTMYTYDVCMCLCTSYERMYLYVKYTRTLGSTTSHQGELLDRTDVRCTMYLVHRTSTMYRNSRARARATFYYLYV